MTVEVEVSGFKTLESVRVRLSPLTVLLGPPAGGKSNLLDAPAGYLGRYRLLGSEYGGQPSLLEPPGLLARFQQPQDLFRLYDLTGKVAVSLGFGGSDRVALELYYSGGALRARLNGAESPANVNPLGVQVPAPQAAQAARALVEWVGKAARAPFDVRVYGYERYGLSARTCQDGAACNFYYRLKGVSARQAPASVLSELGWNATLVLRRAPRVVIDVNEALREHLGERVELKVLRSGSLTVFDYDYEVDVTSLSDGILRAIYYLLALHSSTNYAKARGLEGRLIVGLEEPETHLFPFLLDLLADYIAEASRHLTVVVSTHNPIFASLLGDRVQGATFYYLYRDGRGATRAVEVDVKALARDLKTLEDVMMMKPGEVAGKYSVERARA